MLYRAGIGPINLDYYMPVFARFEAANRVGLGWNWSASLYTLNWMVFRNLWSAALVYLGILIFSPLLIFGVGGLVFHASDTVETSLWVAFAALCFLVPGLLGNAFFYKSLRKQMTLALTASKTVNEAGALLTRQAGSRRRFIGLVILNLVLACAAALAYVALPDLSLTTLIAAKSPQAPPPSVNQPTDPAPKLAPEPLPGASAASSAPSQAASAPQVLALPAWTSWRYALFAEKTVSTPPLPASPDLAASATLAASAASDIKTTPEAASQTPNKPKLKPAPPRANPAILAAAATRQVLRRPGAALTASAPEAAAATPVASAPALSVSMPKAALAAPRHPAKAKTGPAARKAAASEPQPTTPAQAAQRYSINVGLFAIAANADSAHAKLLAAGLSNAFTQKLKTPQGERIRVRVGPFDTQSEADAAAQKIQALQLDAVVFQH